MYTHKLLIQLGVIVLYQPVFFFCLFLSSSEQNVFVFKHQSQLCAHVCVHEILLSAWNCKQSGPKKVAFSAGCVLTDYTRNNALYTVDAYTCHSCS